MSATAPPAVLRAATVADAAAAAECLRCSIRTLCVDDHRDDAATLDAWLANKTAAHLARWIAAPDNRTVVALRAAALAGVGMLDLAHARITLLYVDPPHGSRARVTRCRAGSKQPRAMPVWRG